MTAIQLQFEFTKQYYYADPEFIKYVSEASDDEWLSLVSERRKESNCSKTILSLFDESGQWSRSGSVNKTV